MPLLTAAVATAACGPESPSSTGAVRDSAGIRIVENFGTTAAEPAWNVTPEPVFRIGWEDGDPLLENVVGGVVLSDGRVMVGDGGSQLLRILDPAGDVLATFGGPGEGPGEFGAVSTLVPLGGDTVLAQDAGIGRVSVFLDTTVVRDRAFVSWVGGAAYRILGRLGGGYALWPPTSFMGSGERTTGWRRFPIPWVDRELADPDTIVLAERWWYSEDDGNPVQPGGFVALSGDRLVHGTNDRAELRWMDRHGVVRQIARWDARPEEPTDAHWMAYERWYRERYSDQYEPDALERELTERRADFEGPLLFFGSLEGDRQGNVWVGEYVVGGPSNRARRYRILTHDGRFLGPVDVPRAIRPLDITDELFLGVEYDELDVQAVALYRIEKEPGTGG